MHCQRNKNTYSIVFRYYYMHSYLHQCVRRVWRYKTGNHKPYIEEEQTTQWPKEKVQKDKQRSTTHTYKTKDRVTRTQLKTGGELMCSGRVSSSCSTSGTRRVNLVTNPVISREWRKDREVFTTSGTYPWSFCDTDIHYIVHCLDLILHTTLIAGCVTWEIQRVPLLEQGLLTL